MQRPPSQYFHTPLSEERRERGWEAIRARLPAQRRQRPRINHAFALAAVALLVVALVAMRLVRQTRGAIDGALLETGSGERQSLELGDGSQVVLEPSTRLQLERVSGREMRLRVEAGAVHASVTHVANRPFTVVAGPVEVHVVGTKFRVELDPTDGNIAVAVTEGRVSLTRLDGTPRPWNPRRRGDVVVRGCGRSCARTAADRGCVCGRSRRTAYGACGGAGARPLEAVPRALA